MYQRQGSFVTFACKICMKCCFDMHEMLFLWVLQRFVRIVATFYASKSVA